MKNEYLLRESGRVIGVLGNRESSTHCNGGVPQDGLEVRVGRQVHWIALEAGLVGILFHESGSQGHQQVVVEKSMRFIL